MSGNTFTWNDKAGSLTGTKDLGVIAQEVEEYFPELVVTDKHGVKKVRYEGLIPVLIEGIKELKSKIDDINNPPNK